MKPQAGPLCLLAIVLVLAVGCVGTFGEVTPQVAPGPLAERPTTLVLGEVRVADASWEHYTADFAKGLAEWFRQHGGFETVLTNPGTTPPAGSVVLVGTITEVDKGSAALRFWVGMGAGQAKAKGDFELQRPDGGTLIKFTARRSYLGGIGIGGAGFLETDELVARLGATVAETTQKWVRGEKIE